MRIVKVILLLFLLIPMGCDKDFEELNVNPNLRDDVDPDELFAYAQYQFYTDYFNGVLTEIWGLNTWMQVQADINGISSAGNEYFMGSDALDNTWRVYYSDVLGSINEAMRLMESDEEAVNKMAILRIFRAYTFQRLTDLWGSVPYSDAFQAINEENIPDFTPAYDSQQEIYTDLLNELKEAVDQFDSSKESFTNEDWLFQGNINSWTKFANTLRLRMALRIADVEPNLAMEHGADVIMQNDFIASNMENVRFPHSSFARNPFFELHNTGQGMRNPSDFLIELLKEDSDPRIGVYAETSPESELFGNPDYVGVPSFLLTSEIDPDEISTFTTSYIGNYFLDMDLAGITMGYAESNFLQAEAALRGWGGVDPGTAYLEGIRAHMELLGVDNQEIDEYIAGSGAYNGTLEQIAIEKWKTFVYTDPIELFSEYRRTGFPILTDENGDEVDITRIPKRFAYPNSELSLNGENVFAVGEGINDFDTPLWWDIN